MLPDVPLYLSLQPHVLPLHAVQPQQTPEEQETIRVIQTTLTLIAQVQLANASDLHLHHLIQNPE